MKSKQTEKQHSIKVNGHQGDAIKAANANNIEQHKQAAANHIEAAKHHLEAAKNHAAGYHEQAAHNTILAYGHSAIAGEFLNDDAKHHAQALKETKYQ
jgi:hypothetical protein